MATRLLEEVLDHAAKAAKTVSFSTPDKALARDLRAAQAFDVTDLSSIMPEWGTLRSAPIPKTPPFDLVWAEWSFVDEAADSKDVWRIGALYKKLSATEAALVLDKVRSELHGLDSGPGPEADGQTVAQADGQTVVQATMFLKLLHGNRDLRLGHLRFELTQFYFFLGPPDESQVRSFRSFPSLTRPKGQRGLTYTDIQTGLGLDPNICIPGANQYWQCSIPWAGLAAFSLMHCKNVVSEPEPKPKNSVLRRIRKCPAVSYKLLRVTAPTKIKSKTGSTTNDEDESPAVRLHVCRGHYKNLQHDRFKVKGWHWWPAHWRGDPSLGAIDKDYLVEKGEAAP